MQRKPGISSVFLLIGLLLMPFYAPFLSAQDAPPQQQAGPLPTPQQLDQLLSPIALYPDTLLAQITTAATNPQEILDVDNWLSQNPSLTGPALTEAAQRQGYDPAFLALVTFPDVIQMMADHIDDYAAIGQAMTADSASVAASIQRLRAQAYASGALRSNQQQTVEVQQVSNQPVYVIQPANPQVVYVPQYNPELVYTAPGSDSIVAASLITFGVGIGIGALVASNQPWGWGGWGWGWGGRGVYYNHGPWGGWYGGYRPPSYWYRPRPIVWGNRPDMAATGAIAHPTTGLRSLTTGRFTTVRAIVPGTPDTGRETRAIHHLLMETGQGSSRGVRRFNQCGRALRIRGHQTATGHRTGISRDRDVLAGVNPG